MGILEKINRPWLRERAPPAPRNRLRSLAAAGSRNTPGTLCRTSRVLNPVSSLVIRSISRPCVRRWKSSRVFVRMPFGATARCDPAQPVQPMPAPGGLFRCVFLCGGGPTPVKAAVNPDPSPARGEGRKHVPRSSTTFATKPQQVHVLGRVLADQGADDQPVLAVAGRRTGRCPCARRSGPCRCGSPGETASGMMQGSWHFAWPIAKNT